MLVDGTWVVETEGGGHTGLLFSLSTALAYAALPLPIESSHTGTGIRMGLLACMLSCRFGCIRKVLATRARAVGLSACWRSMLEARKRVDCIPAVLLGSGESIATRWRGREEVFHGRGSSRAARQGPLRIIPAARRAPASFIIDLSFALPTVPRPPQRRSDTFTPPRTATVNPQSCLTTRYGTRSTDLWCKTYRTAQERVTMPFKFVTGTPHTSLRTFYARS